MTVLLYYSTLDYKQAPVSLWQRAWPLCSCLDPCVNETARWLGGDKVITFAWCSLVRRNWRQPFHDFCCLDLNKHARIFGHPRKWVWEVIWLYPAGRGLPCYLWLENTGFLDSVANSFVASRMFSCTVSVCSEGVVSLIRLVQCGQGALRCTCSEVSVNQTNFVAAICILFVL